MVFIVRKKLSADQISPAGTRYNADCDCVQQTPDDGTTWVDAPGLDPRTAPGFRLPATTVDDPQCNAAANMVAKLRFFVETDLASATMWGLASALLAGILLFVPGVGIIVNAILIAADVILSIGSGAIAGAFTEGVYDDFLCVFYCNIDADGQMSDSQLAAIYAKVATDFDSVVQAVFGAHSSTMGPVGWSNAGVRGESEDADCSACVCGGWTKTWLFDDDQADWQTQGGTTYGAGAFHSTFVGGSNFLNIYIELDEFSGNFSGWSVDLDQTTGGAGAGGIDRLDIYSYDVATGLGSLALFASAPWAASTTYPTEDNPNSGETTESSITNTGLFISIRNSQTEDSSDAGGSADLRSFTLGGTGDCPFAEGCDE